MGYPHDNNFYIGLKTWWRLKSVAKLLQKPGWEIHIPDDIPGVVKLSNADSEIEVRRYRLFGEITVAGCVPDPQAVSEEIVTVLRAASLKPTKPELVP